MRPETAPFSVVTFPFCFGVKHAHAALRYLLPYQLGRAEVDQGRNALGAHHDVEGLDIVVGDADDVVEMANRRFQ